MDKDEEIVKYIKQKDRNGLVLLIDNYGKLIYGVIKDVTYNKNMDNEIEDIFSEVLMKIWNSIDLYDEKRGILRNFLISKSKYTAIDHIRKIFKRKENQFSDEIVNALGYEEENFDEISNRESFEELLDTLEPMDKEIFIRRYYFEEEIANIAKSLDKKESYIYTRLSRGRKKLKNTLLSMRLMNWNKCARKIEDYSRNLLFSYNKILKM